MKTCRCFSIAVCLMVISVVGRTAVGASDTSDGFQGQQPKCWMSVYLDPDVSTFYPCAADLAAHGVGGISCDPRRNNLDRAARWLRFVRRHGLKVMDEVVGIGNNPTQGVRP